MPRKRGSKATPSAKWSALEIAAMLTAWRDALETPKYRGFTVRTHMFDQFVEHCGGTTSRALASVCFKRETLRNMADLICEYHASVEATLPQTNAEKETARGAASDTTGRGDTATDPSGSPSTPSRDLKWFSLSVSERKGWFEERNTRSYTYLDIDVETFLEVKELQELVLQYENTRSKHFSQRVKLQREKGENEDEWHAARGRAVMSSQAAVDLAAALIARPVEKSTLPSATAVESAASSTTGGGQTSIQEQAQAMETAASIVARPAASVVNDGDEYGSETQEEDGSPLGSLQHQHHTGDDGSSTESDSDVGVWDEDENQDGASDDTEEEKREGGVESHEKGDGAASGNSSQSNNETAAPDSVRTSEAVKEHEKSVQAAAAEIPTLTDRIDRSAFQGEEASLHAQDEVSAKPLIEASSSPKAAAAVKDAEPRTPAPAQPDAGSSRELERQHAVSRDLLKIVQTLETQAEHLTFMQHQAKHANNMSRRARQTDLERMRRLDKVVLELETQMKNALAGQNTYRDEKNLVDAARSKRFVEQLEDIRTEGGNERHLLVSQINEMRTQWEKRDAERQKELEELKLERAKLQKEASERDGALASLKLDLAEMQRSVAQITANNKATHTSTQQVPTAVADPGRGTSTTQDKGGDNQIVKLVVGNPERGRERERAVPAEETEAPTQVPEKSKASAEKKLPPRKPSPKRVTARQSSLIKTKQSPEPETLPRTPPARKSTRDQNTASAPVLHSAATLLDANPASRAKEMNQPVKRQKIAHVTPIKEAIQKSTPPNQTGLGDTEHRGNAGDERDDGKQAKKLVAIDPRQGRKRKRAVVAQVSGAEIKALEKRVVLAEKKLPPREPSPKRSTARQSSIIETKQSPDPASVSVSVAVPRARKTRKDQYAAPVQLPNQPATPIDAMPTNPTQSEDQHARIQKSPPATVAEPERIPLDALPIPTYRTRGSRVRMKENTI